MKRAPLSALLLLVLALPTMAQNDMAHEPDASQPAPLAAPASAATPPATPADPKNPPASSEASTPAGTLESICLMIEAAATANRLPPEFFAAVIWQESSFRADAIGPVTRNGQRAEGIAQFMPGTASERRLLDPFDPVQALPKSAEYLRELLDQFGNLGLAAAAYNAGPKRVHDWIAHQGGLPRETRNYVRAITGISVDDWAAVGGDTKPSQGSRRRPNCRELTAGSPTSPNPFVTELERRVSNEVAKPWGVELSASFSRTQALDFYSAAVSRYSVLLAGHDPSILRTRNRSRGTSAFYQVRVGADTRMEANRLCASLRAVGGACMVLRNPRGGA
jgi:hypothetical protein